MDSDAFSAIDDSFSPFFIEPEIDPQEGFYNGRTSGHWSVSQRGTGSAIDDRCHTIREGGSVGGSVARGCVDGRAIPSDLIRRLATATRQAREIDEEAKQADGYGRGVVEIEDRRSETQVEIETKEDVVKGFHLPVKNDSRGIRIRHKDGRIEVVKQPSAPPRPNIKIEPKKKGVEVAKVEKAPAQPPMRPEKTGSVTSQEAAKNMRSVRIVGKNGQEAVMELPMLRPTSLQSGAQVTKPSVPTAKELQSVKAPAAAKPPLQAAKAQPKPAKQAQAAAKEVPVGASKQNENETTKTKKAEKARQDAQAARLAKQLQEEKAAAELKMAETVRIATKATMSGALPATSKSPSVARSDLSAKGSSKHSNMPGFDTSKPPSVASSKTSVRSLQQVASVRSASLQALSAKVASGAVGDVLPRQAPRPASNEYASAQPHPQQAGSCASNRVPIQRPSSVRAPLQAPGSAAGEQWKPMSSIGWKEIGAGTVPPLEAPNRWPALPQAEMYASQPPPGPPTVAWEQVYQPTPVHSFRGATGFEEVRRHQSHPGSVPSIPRPFKQASRSHYSAPSFEEALQPHPSNHDSLPPSPRAWVEHAYPLQDTTSFRQQTSMNAPTAQPSAASNPLQRFSSPHIQPHAQPPTVFAGRGWISPHPLSVAPSPHRSPRQTSIRLPSRSGHARMSYEEWQQVRQEIRQAASIRQVERRNFSRTSSGAHSHLAGQWGYQEQVVDERVGSASAARIGSGYERSRVGSVGGSQPGRSGSGYERPRLESVHRGGVGSVRSGQGLMQNVGGDDGTFW